MAKLKTTTQNNNRLVDITRKVAGLDLDNDITTEELTSKICTGEVGYGDRIIDKKISINGYIKYASGLTIQWGSEFTGDNDKGKQISLPINFSNPYYQLVGSTYMDTSAANSVCLFLSEQTPTSFKAYGRVPAGNYHTVKFRYIAIGI